MQDNSSQHIRRYRARWRSLHSTLVDYAEPTSLSSGEAELHGISKGMQHALGLQSLYKDIRLKVELRVHSDATAAIEIVRRRELGKLRHLDCEDPWIQQHVRKKEIQLLKVLGPENPADILTKYRCFQKCFPTVFAH